MNKYTQYIVIIIAVIVLILAFNYKSNSDASRSQAVSQSLYAVDNNGAQAPKAEPAKKADAPAAPAKK